MKGLDKNAIAVAVGYGSACALTPNGARCWGNNKFGQLGDGSDNESLVPVEVEGF